MEPSNEQLFSLARSTALARMGFEEDAAAQQIAGAVALATQGKEVRKAKKMFDLIDQYRGENSQIITQQMGTTF